ncbi:MAG: carbohydrate kinase [Pseudomonadota bacterium]
MRPVVCFGEALIDFLNTGSATEDGLDLGHYVQYPGGAPANAAVAAARLGADAHFAGQVGADTFGEFLVAALERYGVGTGFVARHPSARTPLAFVHLDADGDRSFSFYRHDTADLAIEPAQVSPAWFQASPVVHLCSNTLTDPHIATVTQRVIDAARDAACTISFDVNLRPNLWPRDEVDIERVNAIVRQADLVKFSSEELDVLCRGHGPAYLHDCIQGGVSAVIVTDGPGPALLKTLAGESAVPTPPVTAVNTTGAGDAFIGAVLFGLARESNPGDTLAQHERMAALVEFAAHCGAHSVQHHGAFVSFPEFADVAAYWPSSP